jgi:acyl carrier protein
MQQEVNIEEKVIKAIRDLGCDAHEILPVHELHLDLGIDSTEMVELTELVRTEFGLQARNVNLKGVKTVREMVEQMERVMFQPNPSAVVNA